MAAMSLQGYGSWLFSWARLDEHDSKDANSATTFRVLSRLYEGRKDWPKTDGLDVFEPESARAVSPHMVLISETLVRLRS